MANEVERNREMKFLRISLWIWLMFVLFLPGVLMNGYVLHQNYDAFDWPTAKGLVIDSWIERIRDFKTGKTHHYEVGIEYVYMVGDEFYHKRDKNDITGFIPGYSLEEAQALVGQFPKAKVIRVHYKPSDHQTSLLVPTVYSYLWVGMVVFSLLLLLILYVMYRQVTDDRDSIFVRDM